MDHKVTVVIGRFQLPHKPHLNLFKVALEKGERVVVILGSAFHARTIKNMFTWSEREQMIRLCFTDEENARMTFIPVRDYNDNKKWYQVVQDKVHQSTRISVGVDDYHIRDQDIRLVGYFKDSSSFYLNGLPWQLIDAGSPMQVDATTLRTMLYESDDLRATFAAMSSYVDPCVINYLKSWCCLPFIHDLRAEYNKIQHENRTYGGEYGLTGDVILEFEVEDDDTYVLLVRRGKWPGKGLFAVPGGFFEPSLNETLFQCALREFFEETQHDIYEPHLREAFVAREFFDAPNRSVRKHIKTMAHHFKMHGKTLPTIRGSAEPGESFPQWVKKSVLSSMEDQMYDDHFPMLHHFLKFEMAD